MNSFLFKANTVGVVSAGRETAPVFRIRRQAGYSLVELIVVIAIIAIMAGFVIIGIRTILPGLRANQAMNQVVNSMREARMLAMSQNRNVRFQFTANNRIEVVLQNEGCTDLASTACWDVVRDATRNPATTLERGHQFIRNGLTDTPDGLGVGAITGSIAFGGTSFSPPNTRRFVFTEDGFLTEFPNLADPINGTIFIGLPNGGNNLTRAVTILGTTGRIRAWRWRNGWQISR